ncbi:MAG TPA: ribosomal RNA small subunit methyltransferase I [Candidatus Paceibacterota bacterium]|nr:ribosomal RNA small subunit methyltransferase I [Candidatus Paceibacterota bacterium]
MGTLSIVATPIGNLEDITLRALRIMKECDVIYAEDTRVIAKLLARYEIKKPLQRLDAATEGKKADEVIERLEAGEHVVFVSDAGTPGISDPGARLVARVRERLLQSIAEDISFPLPPVVRVEKEISSATRSVPFRIEAIPGPSALAAAISIAGLTSDQFTFRGFLPHKKGRQTALKEIGASDIPVILYESPHRIMKLLEELAAAGIETVSIGRELTKMHEEFLTGEPRELAADLEKRDAIRGEFVVIVGR